MKSCFAGFCHGRIGNFHLAKLSPAHRAAANTLWRLGFHWNQRRCVWQHPFRREPENYMIVNSQIYRTVLSSHQRATVKKSVGSCIILHQKSVSVGHFDAEVMNWHKLEVVI
jgi:hypothetical protein